MKYNSIGEQLIAKAQELDPNYKPDKFNDMSEAINIILKNSGGGGKSVPPTLNLIDFENGRVRTTITEEEKTNLENGLYNQVIFPGLIPDDFQLFVPSKLVGDKSLDVNAFVQFNCVMGDTPTINALSLYSYSFGAKDTSGNYPITIEKQFDMPIGGSGSVGGGNIWYNLNTTSGTITQNQYDEIKSLIDSNSLAGIKHTTLDIYFPLVKSENNGTFTFGNYGLGSESTGDNTRYSMTEMEMIIKSDLSVSFNIKDVYVPILTQNLSSQSIPSIKTDGYQENLTIGNGLAIENGVLKTTYSKRVFEPTITNVIRTINDEKKVLVFGFDVSNFEILPYLTALIENNKPFTETLYLKTPVAAEYNAGMMINTPLSLINTSTNIDDIYHCFYVALDAAINIKGKVSYIKDKITLNLYFSNEESYTGFKQLTSLIFTNDTKIKITIKTDE